MMTALTTDGRRVTIAKKEADPVHGSILTDVDGNTYVPSRRHDYAKVTPIQVSEEFVGERLPEAEGIDPSQIVSSPVPDDGAAEAGVESVDGDPALD